MCGSSVTGVAAEGWGRRVALPLLRGHCRERSLYPWDASSDSLGVTALPSVPGGAYRPWLGTPKAQRRGSGGSSVRGKVVSDSPAERRQVPQAGHAEGGPPTRAAEHAGNWGEGVGCWPSGWDGPRVPDCVWAQSCDRVPSKGPPS